MVKTNLQKLILNTHFQSKTIFDFLKSYCYKDNDRCSFDSAKQIFGIKHRSNDVKFDSSSPVYI